MTTIHKNSRKRKPKHIKGQNRSKYHVYLGTPQVLLSSMTHKQQHELLSDWEDAS